MSSSPSSRSQRRSSAEGSSGPKISWPISTRSPPPLPNGACARRQSAGDDELEDLILKQTVAANLATKDKDDEWRRIREEQREKFIDLVSSGED